jgi:3-phenylpropionate/cinnamic acid dioxygenase small subunit
MDPATRLVEKDEIRELLTRYCHHYDDGDFTQWLALWTEDGLLDVDGQLYRGRAGLEAFTRRALLVDGKPQMKHIVTNELISVDGERAEARCYLLVVRKAADGALFESTAGTYSDEIVKRSGRWHFAKRVVRRDLRAAQPGDTPLE